MFTLLASILPLLSITASEESKDYVEHKTPFQLHTLLTEQPHPKTKLLSATLQTNTKEGLDLLFSVDEDISLAICTYDLQHLQSASYALETAMLEGKKIYLYGCGATGRLAKQVESCFWRPFWKCLQSHPYWNRLKDKLPLIEERLLGEMTGGDRALISSLEGFEDLPLIGKLQLQDHDIQARDVVFCITEGGETSSVIGTILQAAFLYETAHIPSKDFLYFFYNNPDSLLLPFKRSKEVLEHPGITKINLTTGPQSITGSTRLQAATSETFVIGVLLEHAIEHVLSHFLTQEELFDLGFEGTTLQEKLSSFLPLQQAVAKTSSRIARLTDLESATYANGHKATYVAKNLLIPVFIDVTERAPTFRLAPLDPFQAQEQKSWIQVKTPALDGRKAWEHLLQRPFKGLQEEHYLPSFLTIEDPYLKQAALRSLSKAGQDQQDLYHFALSSIKDPQAGDLGLLILAEEELVDMPLFQPWLDVLSQKDASIACLYVGPCLEEPSHNALWIPLKLPPHKDPLRVRAQIGLKMLLNAHSTAVMTKLGRVVENTMTYVSPSNFKLLGRATFLMQYHINAHLPFSKQLSYEEANALLFEAISYTKAKEKVNEGSEVALSIVRALESLRRREAISWEEADLLVQSQGLESFLRLFRL